MKIEIDTHCCCIRDLKTDQNLTDCFWGNAYAFEAIIQATLTPSQAFNYYGGNSITFIISAKKEAAMRAEIKKQKQIFRK